MTEVLGALLIFTLVPLLGALPLTGWIVRLCAGKQLKKLGTGNVGVSAAFYHGGRLAGILSILAEALKGIAAVLIARYFFGSGDAIWPLLSLIFLVMGRYWGSQGAGTTNVVWGFFVYDPLVAALILFLSFVGFTLFRLRQQGRLFALVLMPILTALFHPSDGGRILTVAVLAGLIAWIYEKMPDDLDLPAASSRVESRPMFRFFQGDRALKSLDTVLAAKSVGAKAATLSQLKAWGYPVPPGYVLAAGDDPSALVETVFSGIANPNAADRLAVVVRSSATGEDGPTASAAGQYVSVTEVRTPAALEQAITACLNAYNAPSAVRYRRDRNLGDGQMNVLVQPQIFGRYSGVAFSRDPVTRGGEGVVVEALPGEASQVVSGRRTPERYRVAVDEALFEREASADPLEEGRDRPWQRPLLDARSVQPQPGSAPGAVPPEVIAQAAYLARHIEARFHGIPQDVEWTFDGEQLWVLQSRPITTLQPIWTRKIAAEVIPGVIRPLTWSINRPLTCGVWGDLFTTVLGDRAAGIDFSHTAALYCARAYFNATLLGELFTRMGLPAESLDFLTRGAKFQRPPLAATLRNLPGLLRLLRQEMTLPADFAAARRERFDPALARLGRPLPEQPLTELSESALISRIEKILDLLAQVTYFNILAPLSLALRQAVLKGDLTALDNRAIPEVRAVEDLKQLAAQLRWRCLQRESRPNYGEREHLEGDRPLPTSGAALFAALADHPESDWAFAQFDRFLATYGYLSEVATDIAVPTWQESPQVVRDLLAQFLAVPETGLQTGPQAGPQAGPQLASGSRPLNWRSRQLQARLNLKGQVAEVYDRLLAHLRGCFVALEKQWLAAGRLQAVGDIFFLTWEEIRTQVATKDQTLSLATKVSRAKARWHQQGQQPVPYLVYGPPQVIEALEGLPRASVVSSEGGAATPLLTASSKRLQGIGASGGNVEGTIRVLTGMSAPLEDIDRQTILVVPYTDAGWSPVLARIGGLIAEAGGQLSHGAIIAREYGIPAVMDVVEATSRLRDGQRVRLDGAQGTIEIL